MSPLAQSTPSPESAPPVAPPQENSGNTATINFSVDGIPLALARQLNVDPFDLNVKDKAKLKDIFKWAQDDDRKQSMSDILRKISKIERQLGAPYSGEKRYDRIWNFIKMNLSMREQRKRDVALFNEPVI